MNDNAFVAIETLYHGDRKTVAAFPRRYPPIPAGSKVRLLEYWNNFYGQWARVVFDGRKYDVEPRLLKAF